jgi:hypothetical protein
MRTFPRSLAGFRKVVKDRCDQLRAATYDDLTKLKTKPTEHFTFDSRPATIRFFIDLMPDGRLRIVAQGFMRARFIPGKHVALDGFYKHLDGNVSPINHDELYEFE